MSTHKPAKADFRVLVPMTTRWTDNDIYGHVNNAIYYHYFDAAINAVLIRDGGLDIRAGSVIGLMVHSECDYFRPVTYPSELLIGVAVAKVGNSSVTYRTAVFESGSDEPAALGSMIHVFVDRASNRPQPIPQRMRELMLSLVATAGAPA